MTTDKDVAPTATVLERWKKEHSEKVQKKLDSRDALMEKMFNALLKAKSAEEAVTFTIQAYRQHLRDMGWLEMAEAKPPYSTINEPTQSGFNRMKAYSILAKAVREELG